MTNTIKAIQTKYAGCHFRSRLEARWAVALDHLRIPWEYEAQGYEVECRVRASGSNDETFAYLPDFYLPTLGIYAEVKGTLTDDEMRRLVDAAAYLSAPHGGCGAGHDLIVLGPVPRSTSRLAPLRIHMCKGSLFITPWVLEPASNRCPLDLRACTEIADDSCGLVDQWEPALSGILLSGVTSSLTKSVPYQRALTAARSARFEHGETPVR